jgi:hypothetical protein
MLGIDLKLVGDKAWPDIKDRHIIHLGNDAPPIGLTVLEGGMASGKPSVAIRLDLPDGRIVVAETSLALLETSIKAIRARYPSENG